MIQCVCRCHVFTSIALQDEANARNEQLNENASSVRRGHVHVVACASSCGVCVLCVCKDEFARLQMCFRVEQCENKIFFIFIYSFFFNF